MTKAFQTLWSPKAFFHFTWISYHSKAFICYNIELLCTSMRWEWVSFVSYSDEIWRELCR